MNETFIPTSDYNNKRWFIIDCKGKKVGRISSAIIAVLIGKTKAYYHPAVDTGDYIILVNAKDIVFDEESPKFRVYVPGRPGRSLKRVINALPRQIIESCVKKMMPEGLPKKRLPKRLKIYNMSEHPHEQQNPIKLENLEAYYECYKKESYKF